MQDFPGKPVRIITALAGSDMDLIARLVAQKLSRAVGPTVTVENHAPDLLAGTLREALPDGHTLLICPQTLWVAPVIQNKPADILNEFSPVTLAATSPLVFFIHPAVTANSIQELIALAKARPGELRYASGLDGSTSHLGGALFNHMAGINMVRVPYKSGLVGIEDLVAGKMQLMIPSAGMGMEHVAHGKLKALAVTSARPSAAVPGLPAVAESGLPGYEVVQTIGMFVPAKTPDAIIKRLNRETVNALKQSDVKEKLLQAGVEVVASSPREFADKIRSEMTKWGQLVQEMGIAS